MTLSVYLITFLICSSCSQFTTSKQGFTPTPALNLPTDNWQQYSSLFTSDAGTIQYSLRYPKEWYVYPGLVKSEPGLEGQTYIQNFIRIGDNNSDYQAPGTVKLAIYALPCAVTEEGCATTGLPTLAPDLPGVRKIDNSSDWTIWTVFLYTKDYRLSLEGYMPGTLEQNKDLITILDEILSTVVIK
jgi:hypothetical protein